MRFTGVVLLLIRVLRNPLTWVGMVVLAVLFSFGLYWFQPWKLVTDDTANDTLANPAPVASSSRGGRPGSAAPTGPRIVLKGTFITHEHGTSGEVRVVQHPDGRRQLEIVNLDTSNGPDLRVWLSDQPVKEGVAGWKVFDDGKYVELGKLKGNKGNQVYDIPGGTDLATLRSVSIWCKRFSVSFGAAALA